MAKKRKQSIEEEQRQSRKEVLLARKQERQTRQVRLAVIGIGALLGLVLLIGVVNELILKPNSPVADVNGTEIAMKDWQDRVRFQRAQFIIGIEDLAEAVGQDIGQVQQFAEQQIGLLEESTTLGQGLLDQMVDEIIIQEEANERGINVSDDDVQNEIEESFSYFDGQSPAPLPTATETVMPTPSLTPIATQAITEALVTNTPQPTATSGPTSTPLPTATPVSLESFEESIAETFDRFGDFGVSEATFRDLVRAQLYQQRLAEALVAEEDIATEAEQVSFYYIVSETMDEAEGVLVDIESSDYLTTWNTIRSQPPDPESPATVVASELLWRTREDVENIFGLDVAESAFDLELQEPSAVIVLPGEGEDASDNYFIIMVSGREVRQLSESAITAAEQQVFQSWIEGKRADGVEIFERWRSNVPTNPILDRRFVLPPPPTPTIEIPTLVPSSEDGDSTE